VPVLGDAVNLANRMQSWRLKGLWEDTHDALKIATYNDAVAKALPGAPVGAHEVKQQIASLLNDAFGGQEWETKFWLSPQVRKLMSRGLLAPDWTLSTLRSVPFLSDVASGARAGFGFRNTVPGNYDRLPGNIARGKFWGGELAALSAATLATQYAIYHAFGDPNKGDKPWTWDNERDNKTRVDITPIMRNLPWHSKDDPTRYYMNLGKRPEEVLRWFTRPDENLRSKASRPVAEVINQIVGSENGDFKAPWKQDHESFAESVPARLKSVGSQFVPFSFAGNSFVLSVPFRKGMTKFKAQDAFENVYEVAAEPGKFKQILRGLPPTEGALQDALDQIRDAAKRNGVPAGKVESRALGEVRGIYLKKYFKAYQAGDEAEMNKQRAILDRLGLSGNSFRKSMSTQQEFAPAE
jgi:hypothetical protein